MKINREYLQSEINYAISQMLDDDEIIFQTNGDREMFISDCTDEIMYHYNLTGCLVPEQEYKNFIYGMAEFYGFTKAEG